MEPSFLSSALAVAEACAHVASAAVLPHFRTALTADVKADASPVSIADRAAERAMRAVLRERCPGHGVLGEEDGRDDRQSDWLWVLDPIDGTRAFLTGRPSFGTLIALFHKGRPVLGVIDQPVTQERWIGLAGERTRFMSPRLPGRIGTRTGISLAQAELSCTSPEILTPALQPRFERLRRHVGRTSWGGDCYAYGLLALGQIDIVAECTMKPWDWGALVPIVEGAGGCMTDWSGAPLTLESDGTVLACADPALMREITCHLS